MTSHGIPERDAGSSPDLFDPVLYAGIVQEQRAETLIDAGPWLKGFKTQLGDFRPQAAQLREEIHHWPAPQLCQRTTLIERGIPMRRFHQSRLYAALHVYFMKVAWPRRRWSPVVRSKFLADPPEPRESTIKIANPQFTLCALPTPW